MTSIARNAMGNQLKFDRSMMGSYAPSTPTQSVGSPAVSSPKIATSTDLLRGPPSPALIFRPGMQQSKFPPSPSTMRSSDGLFGEPRVLMFSEAFLLRFQNEPPKEELRKRFAAKHPCLRVYRSCAYGDRCYFSDLPQEWCVLCLMGEEHTECKGTQPDMHPCVRVWGSCKYGDQCVFRVYPRAWCLFCLRRAPHAKCSGVKPKHLPPNVREQGDECSHERASCRHRHPPSPGRDGPVHAAHMHVLQHPPHGHSHIPYGNTQTQGYHSSGSRTPPPPLSSPSFEILRSEMGTPPPGDRDAFIPSSASLIASLCEARNLASPVRTQELPNRAPAPFGNRSRAVDPVTACSRQVKGVLNKITPEKHTRLMEQMIEILTGFLQKANAEAGDAEENVDVKKLMDVVAEEVFEKAVTEINNSNMYAKVSADLERGLISALGSVALPSELHSDKKPEGLGMFAARVYRSSLLRRAHHLFYSAGPNERNSDSSSGSDIESGIEADEELLRNAERHKQRSRANTRFVGQLYMLGRVPVRVIAEIVQMLLSATSERPLGPRIELFISLLQACGSTIEKSNGDGALDGWFRTLARFKAENQVSKRISFLIDNLFELRRKGWQDARGKKQPMTLAEAEEMYYRNKHSAQRAVGIRNSPSWRSASRGDEESAVDSPRAATSS